MPYRCKGCGYVSPKWLGRCPGCGVWESFVQVEESAAESGEAEHNPQPLAQVEALSKARVATGLPETDRILGGGFIPGSVVLVGGEPGVGKSTFLLQLSGALATHHGAVLYISGEESPAQLKLRAQRLGVPQDRLYVLSEQNLLPMLRAVQGLTPVALVVDSLQTVRARQEGGDMGAVPQVREAAGVLARLAKGAGLVCFLVSHITKGGEFAGPKTVEHLVDVALYLEGSRDGELRLIRSVKNRFGSTDEVAVLRMAAEGLVEVANPSTFFVSAQGTEQPGSAIVPVLEGSRTLLMEVQALLAPASGYGPPQRRGAGLDLNRVLVLLAVLEKHLGIHMGMQDCYLAVAGGLEVREPACDLGVIAAVLSSLRVRALPPQTVVLGEVGLAGDVRPVRRGPERLREVAKLGFRRAILPVQNLPASLPLEVNQVRTVEEAARALDLT
ncbi:MAG: DNA repair protein RadA [Candidatus Bipolaricaulota bacterium]